MSIDNKNRIAVKAALGFEGVMEGIDYRNMPVFASVQSIPGTAWSIVAKMDQAEVNAPLRERGLTTAVLAMIVVVLTAVLLGYLGRFHNNRWLRSQLVIERESRLILDSIDEGVLGLDSEGRHVFVNPSACRLLGYEPAELVGKASHAIWHHTKADGSPYPPQECLIYSALHSGISCRSDQQEVFWRKNGTSFSVEYVATPTLEKDRPVALTLVFRDVTTQRQHEKERNLAAAHGVAIGTHSIEWSGVGCHHCQNC